MIRMFSTALKEVHWVRSVGSNWAAGRAVGVRFTKVLVISFRLCINPDFEFVQLFIRWRLLSASKADSV